jgi:hypothetical protein
MEVGDQPHAPATLSSGNSPIYPSDWKLGGPQIRPGSLGYEKKICSSQLLIRNYVKVNMHCVVWNNLPPFVPNNREEAWNFFVRIAGILLEIWTKEILNMTAGMLSIRCVS